MTEELSTQKGRDMFEMIMKNHNFTCKARGSDYFSRGLGVTQMASTVFKGRGSCG